MDEVDPLSLGGVVRQHGDHVVTSLAVDIADAVDLPAAGVEGQPPVFERHHRAGLHARRDAPRLVGLDVLHEVELVGL